MSTTTLNTTVLRRPMAGGANPIRRVFSTLWAALEANGRRRAAFELEQRAAQYVACSPGYAQELLKAAASLRAE